jgi:hypothetical protein
VAGNGRWGGWTLTSHLRKRKFDGVEIFQIKKQRWVEYWLNQHFPVVLIIGTFAEGGANVDSPSGKLEFDQVRWMEISSVLKKESVGGKRVRQIEFKGEPMDSASIHRWRQKFRPTLN